MTPARTLANALLLTLAGGSTLVAAWGVGAPANGGRAAPYCPGQEGGSGWPGCGAP